uniref:Uncharacterized protein n=1 Tax=Paramormyrops kingsleyae TaxID=1676925 RepID=A0A3B3SY78_9TELE
YWNEVFNVSFLKTIYYAELDNVNCYRIEPVTMVGIVIGDLALTVLLVSIAYHCNNFMKQGNWFL